MKGSFEFTPVRCGTSILGAILFVVGQTGNCGLRVNH